MKPFNQDKHEPKALEIGDICTHGDVVIERINKLPDGFPTYDKAEKGVLAYGEMTGHVHMLEEGEFDVRVDPGNTMNRILHIIEDAVLKHQEHKQIKLPKGFYRTRIQTEYNPFTKRLQEVAD